MSMIDKVAAAIATFSTGSADNYKSYRDEARAAVEEMLNPTEAMIEAGRAVPCDDEISGGVVHSSATEVRAIWQAMLQAALHGDQEG